MPQDEHPTISVVVPVHNKASHLARSFNSIFEQTYPAAEIIAVDDVSTDNSRAILRQMSHPKLKVIERDADPAGPGGARNVGIRAATGDWVAFLDADDEWKPDFLETIAAEAARADEGVACIFTGFEDDYNGRRNPHLYVASKGALGVQRLNLKTYITDWLETRRSPIHTSSVVIRRRVLEAVGMFPEGPNARRGQDIALWLKTVAYGDAIFKPAIGATYYREAENMVTKTVSANMRPVICTIIRDLLPTRTPDEQRLLERLNNHIIYDYARIATRSERFNFGLMRNLYPTRDIRKSMALLAMIMMPPAVRRSLRGLRGRTPAL
ncbi:fucosyltransferase [Agaricicola taiwanensis]|uniref:Fucosyltransferase n=1 Tax=Agaricicola taiwanensis TaxID=591372 RepID=A0A8J2YKQ2_9RHOB|nr:glycosyltransferase family 2 protein [Agaricicola taiwanensis]GGE48933.1 fucosyltransferase [Agaricicola taiwanensis]